MTIDYDGIKASVQATAEIMLFTNARRNILGKEITEETITRTLHSTSEVISQQLPQLRTRGNHCTKFWSVKAIELFKSIPGTARQRGMHKLNGRPVFHNEHEMPINVTRKMIESGELDTVEKLTQHLLDHGRQIIITKAENDMLNANGLATGKSIDECSTRYEKIGIEVTEFDTMSWVADKRKSNTSILVE